MKVVPFAKVPKSWDDPQWWYDLAYGLPETVCPKCHGYAFRRYWLMERGRQVGYHCHPCGWEQVVWVQEGWAGRPERPSDGVGVPDPPQVANRELARVSKQRRKARVGVGG